MQHHQTAFITLRVICQLSAFIALFFIGQVNAATVPAPNQQAQLNVYYSPSVVDVGESVSLWWNTANVDRCELDGIGNITLGVGTLTNITEPYSKQSTIRCYHDNGDVLSRSAFLTVNGTPALTEIASFTAPSQQTNRGDAITLSWSVNNATSYTMDNGVTFSSNATSVSVAPLTTTTYTLTANGTFGPVSESITINVIIADSDNDGMPDYWELLHGFNLSINDAALDSDGDGLSNLGEFTANTQPGNPDSDGDGIPDGYEVLSGNLDPNDPTDVEYGVEEQTIPFPVKVHATTNDTYPNVNVYLPFLDDADDSNGAVNTYHLEWTSHTTGNLRTKGINYAQCCGVTIQFGGDLIINHPYPGRVVVKDSAGNPIGETEWFTFTVKTLQNITYNANMTYKRKVIVNGPDNDRDLDGVIDQLDAFPDNPSEWEDSDGDGVGDNSDAFPNNYAESRDVDKDGIGDNVDPINNKAMDYIITTYAENSGAFPNVTLSFPGITDLDPSFGTIASYTLVWQKFEGGSWRELKSYAPCVETDCFNAITIQGDMGINTDYPGSIVVRNENGTVVAQTDAFFFSAKSGETVTLNTIMRYGAVFPVGDEYVLTAPVKTCKYDTAITNGCEVTLKGELPIGNSDSLCLYKNGIATGQCFTESFETTQTIVGDSSAGFSTTEFELRNQVVVMANVSTVAIISRITEISASPAQCELPENGSGCDIELTLNTNESYPYCLFKYDPVSDDYVEQACDLTGTSVLTDKLYESGTYRYAFSLKQIGSDGITLMEETDVIAMNAFKPVSTSTTPCFSWEPEPALDLQEIRLYEQGDSLIGNEIATIQLSATASSVCFADSGWEDKRETVELNKPLIAGNAYYWRVMSKRPGHQFDASDFSKIVPIVLEGTFSATNCILNSDGLCSSTISWASNLLDETPLCLVNKGDPENPIACSVSGTVSQLVQEGSTTFDLIVEGWTKQSNILASASMVTINLPSAITFNGSQGNECQKSSTNDCATEITWDTGAAADQNVCLFNVADLSTPIACGISGSATVSVVGGSNEFVLMLETPNNWVTFSEYVIDVIESDSSGASYSGACSAIKTIITDMQQDSDGLITIKVAPASNCECQPDTMTFTNQEGQAFFTGAAFSAFIAQRPVDIKGAWSGDLETCTGATGSTLKHLRVYQ